MEYKKRKLVKYSNRLFPKFEEEHWEVEITDKHNIGFHSFENAMIFDKLKDVEKKLDALLRRKVNSK